MNRLALSWVDTALALEAENEALREENRALRDGYVELVFWIRDREELWQFVRESLATRFPNLIGEERRA